MTAKKETKNNANGNAKAASNAKAGSNAKAKGNGVLEVVFILDRSGSMSGLEEDTIGGFNSTLEKQKAESENVIWSTVLFDTSHDVIHNRMPIQMVEPLNERQYYVRGCTALLDAVGRAIHHIAMCHKYARAEDVPERTLFIITTDGMENSSYQYTYRKVKEMIGIEQEQYGWEFLFLGANIDAVSEADRLGIRAGRAATFVNDDVGISKNYEAFGTVMCKMSRMEAFCDSDIEECLAPVREDFEKRGGRR